MIYFDKNSDLWAVQTPVGLFGFDTKDEAELFVEEYDEDREACLKKYLG